MEIQRLISKLQEKGIFLRYANGKLAITGNNENLSPELLSEIKKHKSALAGHLKIQLRKNKAVKAVEKRKYYPLSHAQRRLWVIDRFKESAGAYNIPSSYYIYGVIDRPAFDKAFHALAARHESLRTIFILVDGEPHQKIQELQEFPLSIQWIDAREHTDKDLFVKDFYEKESRFSFDLEKGPLFRVNILRLEAEKYCFIFNIHHIISDGWSSQVFTREILHLYSTFQAGKSTPLNPLRIQYKDYTLWQNAQLKGTSLHQTQSYWLNQFKEEIPLLNFPADFSRPLSKTYNGSAESIVLGEEISREIQRFSQLHGTTIFMTLVALIKTLLFRYTSQSDIILGSPIAGRNNQDLESQIGLYVNMLALRTKFSADDSFETLLAHVKETTLDAYDHQVYPFDRLVEDLQIPRDLSRNPLFDMIVNIQNAAGEKTQNESSEPAGALRFEQLDTHTASSKFDLIFNFLETSAGVELSILYNTDLFKQGRIERFLVHFKNLAIAALTNPTMPLKTLSYLPTIERDKILTIFNHPSTYYPSDKTVQEIFSEQVTRYPETEAIRFEDRALSYVEFDEITNRIAHHLRDTLHVQPDDRIALLTDRSLEMLICIWSIIKSGACYVPIDPTLPNERIRFLLEDTGAKAAITHTGRTFQGLAVSCKLLTAADLIQNSQHAQTSMPSNINRPDDLLYIIYTSGSTGKPKGVMITHRNVIARVKNAEYYPLGADNRSLLVANYTFDVSILDIFGPSLNGGTVCIASAEDSLRIEPISNLVTTYGITSMSLATPVFNALMDIAPQSISGIRKVYFGGEEASRKHIEIALQYAPEGPVNIYGPTETTVLATVFAGKDLTSKHLRVPIGKPVSNTYIHILDESLTPVPIGVTGEIYIGGDGVGRGYLNRDALTKERFVQDPLSPGDRVYKSGDLGRWLPDGSILFEGRKDQQVKVRGYRIELGEIENAMLETPGIGEAVVLTKGESAESKYLAAYYTATGPISEETLRTSLSALLPIYMVPAVFIKMDKFPLNSNGKIDRKVLPDPGQYADNLRNEYTEPQSDLERKLQSIWSGVLDRERISTTDNFFSIGGHSLKATKLMLTITKQLEVVLDLKDIFSYPTIKSLAECIATKERNVYQGIAVADATDHYALSHAQRRLWILDQMEDKLTAYNIPSAFYLKGQLDSKSLEKALQDLIIRHEILRTTFIRVDGQPMQKIHGIESAQNFRLDFADIRQKVDRDLVVEAIVNEEANQFFNLEKGPLLKAKLLRLEDDLYLFLFTIHHILSDGWSMGIITRETLQLYNSIVRGETSSLEPLRIQYKDYASWQHEQLIGGNLKKNQGFWKNLMQFPLPVLDLPYDFPRPAMKGYEGASDSFTLSGEQLKKIRALCVKHDTTTFMFLLAAFKVLFFKYTGQTDIIIGSPAAGRSHPDLEKQIGFYVNTLPLRTQFSPDDSMESMLAKVKKNVIEAYDHQVYPFDMLVDELDLERDMSRMPLFDVMLSYQHVDQRNERAGINDSQSGTLNVEGYPSKTTTSKFDLTISILETNQMLVFNTDFCIALFDGRTIKRMHQHLSLLVAALLSDTTKPLKDISYLSHTERKELFERRYNASRPYTIEQTIVEQFDHMAATYPDKIALSLGAQELTFSQLHQKANAVAFTLINSYGVRKNDIVPILIEHNFAMPIALWGILKAGAAFVPLDPKWPVAWLNEVLIDAKASVIVSSCSRLRGCFPQIKEYWLDHNALHARKDNVTIPISLSDPIYAIYTPDANGKPKGALNKHLGIANRFSHMTHCYGPKPDDVVLLTTNYIFDMAIAQLLWPMTLGVKTVIPEKEENPDMTALRDLIEEHEVVVMHMSSSELRMLAENFQQRGLQTKLGSLRHILVKSDPSIAQYVNDLKSMVPSLSITTEYGPAEASIGALFFDVTGKMGTNLIGSPMSHVPFLIMDAYRNPVPEGIAGELWLGGYCVGLGYVNNTQLTAETFIKCPVKEFEGETFYRTGDRVRLLAENRLEFLGRTDTRVRMGGNQIELNGVAAVIKQHADVSSTVVTLVQNETGMEVIAGYYCSENLLPETLRDFLLSKMPASLVPEFLQPMEKLPMTTGGKINLKALPKPATQSAVISAALENEMERKLKAVWEDVLQTQHFEITDNFFALGGHSLKALKVQSRISQLFDIEIKIKDFFMYPTVQQMAERIQGLLTGHDLEIDANEKSDTLMEFSIGDEDDSAVVQLFCIPFGGGGKHIFEGMKTHAPAHLKIEAIELPGRGERAEEPLLESTEAMVNDLYDQIKDKVDKSYAFFGHSMGGLLCYLLTQKLLQEGAASPVHLFVSSCVAPHQYTRWFAPIEQETLQASIKKEFGLEGDLLNYVTTILSADLRAIADCQVDDHEILNIPLTLLKGDHELINETDILEWKKTTTEEVSLFTYSGDHFYLFKHEAELVTCIDNQLKLIPQLK